MKGEITTKLFSSGMHFHIWRHGDFIMGNECEIFHLLTITFNYYSSLLKASYS